MSFKNVIKTCEQMAVEEKLVVLADEVYQSNIWKKDASFSSFKKVSRLPPSRRSNYGVTVNAKIESCIYLLVLLLLTLPIPHLELHYVCISNLRTQDIPGLSKFRGLLIIQLGCPRNGKVVLKELSFTGWDWAVCGAISVSALIQAFFAEYTLCGRAKNRFTCSFSRIARRLRVGEEYCMDVYIK